MKLSQEISWLLKEKYGGKAAAGAKEDIARLKAGEPVDYLISHVEFAGASVDLSLRPLIPRLETEYWTLGAIAEMQKRNKKLLCLDIFAGSGCVGVAVLKNVPSSSVDFAEKEPGLASQIQVNLKRNALLKRRFRVIQSDIFSGVKGKYDYILANPPYVAEKRWKSVGASVKKYEPKNALAGGVDGLLYMRRFLKEAKAHLLPQGIIYLEFDSPQKRAIAALLKKHGYSFEFQQDQYGKWRFAVISQPQKGAKRH